MLTQPQDIEEVQSPRSRLGAVESCLLPNIRPPARIPHTRYQDARRTRPTALLIETVEMAGRWSSGKTRRKHEMEAAVSPAPQLVTGQMCCQ